ncbi:SAM-dependent chlorinase/fluorinase [Desulfobulbus sp. TB]|nr:SAM-dependent chlorinase/fluorinase [Desulfobulbus sp. TB]
MQPSGIITLTTDFGLVDPYLGQMKGAILRQNPTVQLVDLSHAIPRQNILEAALVLHSSYAFFPSGTVHLVVVDPGVGSQRRMLVAKGDSHYFVAPDNGIFSLLLREEIVDRVYQIEEKKLFAEAVSATFHGRDIMGPIAAALAQGVPLDKVGPETAPASCVSLALSALPVARITGQEIRGQVLQIDHFGNIRTTVRRQDLKSFIDRPQCTPQCHVQINGQHIQGLQDIRSTYAEAKVGELLALIDSAGYLEIAVNQGSAAEYISCSVGDGVQIVFPPPSHPTK